MRSHNFRGLALTALGCASVLTAGAAEELEEVVVTGSRIATLEREGPSPVVVVTADDIEARGFGSVYEALDALTQNTGAAQTEQFTSGFTQNANTVDLRGMGPGRTLVLVDGRRIAEYPRPYNGDSNFVNLASIPSAAVERIEILAGGASAIYGSDAVAGVMNIITKKHLDTPLDMDIRYGGATQGGGASWRLRATGGQTFGDIDLIYTAEFQRREPVYAFQRNFMDSVQDNPDPASRINPRALLHSDPFDSDEDGLPYVDPGSAACRPFRNMVYSDRDGFGAYCGQPDDSAQVSIRNGRKRGALHTRATWNLDTVELFGTVSYFQSADQLDTNSSWWANNHDAMPFVRDVADGSYVILQRFFQPEEIGGRAARARKFDERAVDVAAGVKGSVLDDWKYEFTLSTSHYTLEEKQRLVLGQAMRDYFFGPELGLDFDDVPIHSVNYTRFYTPLTPAVWNTLTDINATDADASSDLATLVFTGDLWSLPAGPLSSALVLEWARQDYSIDLDPQLLAGDFWDRRDTGGGGKRSRYAAGLELNVPIIAQLDMKLAGRYDQYDDVTAVDGAFTYNVGLTYRPMPQVLLRGSLATSFRAPDMHQVFANTSEFFVASTDYYLCRRDEPGTPYAVCAHGGESVAGSSRGSRDLREEKGRSYSFGIVLQPLDALTFSTDFYDVRLTGAVLADSIPRLLKAEADCRLGVTEAGVPVNVNTAVCAAVLARVARRPNDGSQFSDNIIEVTTFPINSAMAHTRGIDSTLRYALPTSGYGRFTVGLAYSHVLDFVTQDFAGDPLLNLRDDPGNFDWRSRITASLSWSYAQFATTLFAERVGSIPDWAATGRITPQTYLNLTGGYSLLDGKADVSVLVTNLLDTKPPRDPTYDVYPYFSPDNYDAIGREAFVQVRYRF